MPHEPKRRHSKERKGERRAHIHLAPVQVITCGNCGNPMQSHRICEHCGFYKGKQVITINQKKKEKTA